jgi:hypothetical protein
VRSAAVDSRRRSNVKRNQCDNSNYAIWSEPNPAPARRNLRKRGISATFFGHISLSNSPRANGRGRVSVRWRITGRWQRAHLVAASVALLPALAGCSSSSSIDYATDAYPNQSLVDLIKGSTASPPPAPPPPGPPVAAANEPRPAAAPPPAAVAPAPAAAPVAVAAPASPPDDTDPVAAAYPSVSLIDLLTGSTKPAPR